MIKMVKFCSILLLMYVISAPSCEDQQDKAGQAEKNMEASRDSIRQTCNERELSASSLAGYEKAARQNLSDLADYLNLLSDTTLAFSFREKASFMASALFYDPQNAIISVISGNMKTSGVSAFTGLLLSKELHLMKIRFEGAYVVSPLRPTNDDTYQGELSCRQIITTDNKNDRNDGVELKVQFFLKHIQKQFGGENLKVWTLYLGNIMPVASAPV